MTRWQLVKRWWAEVRKPVLRCERVGHKVWFMFNKYIAYPPARWREGVADTVTESKKFCSHCQQDLTDWTEHRREPIHSLSMPDSSWEILKRDGKFSSYKWSEPEK